MKCGHLIQSSRTTFPSKGKAGSFSPGKRELISIYSRGKLWAALPYIVHYSLKLHRIRAIGPDHQRSDCTLAEDRIIFAVYAPIMFAGTKARMVPAKPPPWMRHAPFP